MEPQINADKHRLKLIGARVNSIPICVDLRLSAVPIRFVFFVPFVISLDFALSPFRVSLQECRAG